MIVGGSIPDPAIFVLVGAAGAGKSTWAAQQFRAAEIVSSDALRAVVGSGESDLDASADAFALLDSIARGRAGRGLAVVIDTLGLDPLRRGDYLELARASGLPAVAVVFNTDAATCRARNRHRDRPVPATVLDSQLARMRDVSAEIADEGWDVVIALDGDRPVSAPAADRTEPDHHIDKRELGFVLQVSSFGWGDDPIGWLREVALCAEQSGFEGIALMGHLIQIPQVGRAWDPIPEPWVTLGFLAGLQTSLRLGTLVSPVTFHAAGVLAKAVSTLDVLTDGRSFAGVGAGWWEREHAAYGLDFPPVASRMDQLEQAIETMRALWAAGTKEYVGERVRLPETTSYPRPVGQPQVIVGGGGERRTLQIAARLGDACNVSSRDETLAHKSAVLRAHCEAAGRDPAEVAVTVLDLPVVGGDRDEAAAIVERLRGRTSAAAYARAHHAGLASQHIERYRGLADLGVSTVFVALPDLTGTREIERFAPITAAFA